MQLGQFRENNFISPLKNSKVRKNKPFLPAIRAEEQMDGPVIELRLVCEVGGDHLPDAGLSVGEPPGFSQATFPLQEGQQPSALRRLAAPVQPFQDYEGAAAAAVLHPRALERGPTLREQADATRSRRRRGAGTPARKMERPVSSTLYADFWVRRASGFAALPDPRNCSSGEPSQRSHAQVSVPTAPPSLSALSSPPRSVLTWAGEWRQWRRRRRREEGGARRRAASAQRLQSSRCLMGWACRPDSLWPWARSIRPIRSPLSSRA